MGAGAEGTWVVCFLGDVGVPRHTARGTVLRLEKGHSEMDLIDLERESAVEDTAKSEARPNVLSPS